MAANTNKGRFGFADLLILLLIAVFVGGGFWFFLSGRLLGAGEEVNISYEVRLTGVRSELTSRVNYGDKVYDPVYGEYVGVVEKVRTEQYTEQVLNKSTGELVNAVKGGYYNMYITVNATAEYKDNAYYISTSEIRVGERAYLRLPNFCGEGYCTALTQTAGGES